MIRALLGLMVVAVGVAAAILQQGQPWTGEAVFRAVHGIAGACLWALSATGVGGLLLSRRGAPADAVTALACGLGVLGLLLLPVVGLGLLGPVSLGLILVVGLAAWLKRPELSWPQVSTVTLVMLAVWCVPGLLDALCPPVDTDEVYQHLALPRLMWDTGGLVGGVFQPDGSRPLPVHMVWTAAWLLGGEAAPKLLHLGWAVALGLKVGQIAGRRAGPEAGALAVALLLGSYTFVREMGLAYNNLPAALWVLLALEAALAVDPDDRHDLGSPWGRLALFAGMALACKYTAAPAVVGIYLIAWHRLGWARVGTIAVLAVAALTWVSPWWIRNGLEGLHPLFPYMGWPPDIPLTFMLPQKYGVGREPLDFLLLPWNATVAARTDSFAFLGRVTPAALALAPMAIWAGIKSRDPLWLAALLAFAGWAAGPQWLRYLLPAAPLLVVCAADGYALLGRLGRSGAWMVWWVGLPANLGPWLADVVDRAPAAVGAETRDDLLSRRVHGYGAVRWINEQTPQDARVALLFAWPTYHVQRQTILGSVEDHIPSRNLVLVHGEKTLEHLRSQGVHYVLAHRIRFLKKSYPFMETEAFEQAFSEPARVLQSVLLAEGVLVYEEGRFGVWRIDKP
jgi:hypothetical protein